MAHDDPHLDLTPAPTLSAATRLVVVEGVRGDGGVVADLLRGAGHGLDLLVPPTTEAALDVVVQDAVDAAVVFAPPHGASLPALVAQVRALAPELPLLAVADDDDLEGALVLVAAGAQDVLHRGALRPAALARALAFAIARERAGHEVARRAMHDPLTGLPNRVLLHDRLVQALGRIGRHEEAVALLVLDLDDFKTVNDTHGHEAGDRLLVEVAQRLTSVLRASDTAARVGGDEFVVLCEDVGGEHEALAVAERITAALAEPFAPAVGGAPVRSSIGIAVTAKSGVRAEVLLREADAAMYRAKAREVAYEVFDAEMRRRAQHRLGMEADLRRAVDDGEFTLHYQPVFRLTTGSITGCEALLRWSNPTRGLLAPGEFLAVAEDAGLMLAIGAWVIGSAARQARLWALERDGAPPPVVSVNLSARQLLHHETVVNVARALDRSGADPATFCLEFTESAVMADPARAGRVVRDLRSLGVRLAIDDFGTAASSLRLLEQLPVDAVKIDRSFIAGMAERHEEAAIVASVIGLAHAFGLEAIAEGVETLAQVDRLRALGVDAAQGHYFAAAQPPGELGGLLLALA
jgi:diguanylate cyclase (GGDEF)-like protein